MNPLRANRLLLGNTAGSPYIENLNGALSFYDSAVGSVNLQTISNVNSPIVKRVAPTLVGADYTSIQDAIDSIEIGERGVIYIYGGEYQESLTIRTDIDLIGISAKVISDGTCLDIEDANVTVQGLELVSGAVGTPRCVQFVSTGGVERLTVKGCVFDTTLNAQASALHVNGGSVYCYLNEYVGDNPNITILNAERFVALETLLYDLTLNNVSNESFVNAQVVRDLVLVGSALNLEADYGSLSGDNASQITPRYLRGSATFNNEASVTVTLDCPIANAEYMVISETLTDRSVLIAENKATTSFDLTADGLKAESVSWLLMLL